MRVKIPKERYISPEESQKIIDTPKSIMEGWNIKKLKTC